MEKNLDATELVSQMPDNGVASVAESLSRHIHRQRDRGRGYVPASTYSVADRLSLVRQELGDCTRCKLSKTRNKIVFGAGAPDAQLMFIGEAPGAEEDKTGQPFVGRAGQLLSKMIDAMGWSRNSVYIANVLKCRPPGNRNPEREEVAACRPFLEAQVQAIGPQMIVTLGKPAAHLILDTTAPISALRGRFGQFQGIAVMPTFHPAYLLRSPDKKRDTWQDLKMVMMSLEKMGISPHK